MKRPGIVHRLDKDTSGLMVIAKTDLAHHKLSAQFAKHGRDGRLERAYRALVWGKLAKRRGSIDAPLARHTSNRQKMAVSKASTARQAITHYEVSEIYPQNDETPRVSLLECRLETGRTHQIRVHMAHLGHPLLSDKAYGSGFKSSQKTLPQPVQSALGKLNRQALHAYLLGFEHPESGEKVIFKSDLPHCFQKLIATLKDWKE